MDAKPTSADGVTPTQTLAAALIRQLGFDEAVCSTMPAPPGDFPRPIAMAAVTIEFR